MSALSARVLVVAVDAMTPGEFIAKWRASELKERSAAQSHFIDLCRLLGDRWLNPPEWMEWIDEPVPGYPKRPVARNEEAAKELKTRTLTNLYNARPQWLADAHATLDAAVAAAYGWEAGISEDDALGSLLR